MKKIKLTAILAVAIAALTLNVNAKEKKTVIETTYKVSMDCEGCKAKIEDKIPFEKGVKDLEVDLKTKKVTVKYDSAKTDSDQIKKSIEKLDFKVEVLPSEPKTTTTTTDSKKKSSNKR